ncbi:MAG TPA: VCBS domain-containing protein, partial [Noviherbaspirillum sp.]|uniref:VCBS domain-containing protein n=1 Tax=Noviherbaspirillum sp. TaxID=1926288 RepID=UPI002D2F7225
STSVTRAAGTLGTLTLAADGSYVYSVDNSAVQYLNPGTRKIDTFTVKAVDDTQKQVSFTINAADRLAPKILFVDDDGGAASSNTWLSILRDLNYTVDSQVLAVDGDPTNLSNYDMVIWAAGDHVGNLTAANVTNLSSYLDNGGNLLYSGKLHGEPSAFVDKYLGVRNYNDNFAYTTYTTYPADAEGIGFLVGRTPHDVRNFSWFYFGKGNSGGNAMSMFGMATARSVVELIDDAGLAYFDGSKDHHVAAFNQTEQFHTATMGFDINQLDPGYRYGLMDKLVQLVGGASWQDVF